MDCFYHNAVPSVAPCTGCGRGICATCRGTDGDCPGCRLGARIDAASSTPRSIGGQRGPSRPQQPPPSYAPPRRQSAAAVAVPVESRALVGLGYPFWPLAVLALFDSNKSPFIKRHAYQALGFNAGIYGMWMMLTFFAKIPLLGIPPAIMLAFMLPVAFVANVVYGFKAWHGEDVRIPIVSDWVDRRLPT